MTKYSIVIPIYNEEDNIEKLVKEIFYYLGKFKNSFEILIIDDGSEDNSLSLIKRLSIQYKNIYCYTNGNNKGQSYSIFFGIKKSKSDTIITLDGDGQNNPKDILKLIKIYEQDNNLALLGGIRIKRKDSLIKIMSSRLANFIRKLILNDNCDDTGCSLKIFDRKTFLKIPFFDGLHRFLPALFSGLGKKTLFINVDHRSRVYGVSKYATIDRLLRGIRDLIKVKKILKDLKKSD